MKKQILTLTLTSALVLSLVAACTSDEETQRGRDAYPTTSAPDPALEAEVREEIAGMTAPILDPNKRELFDGEPNDVAIGYLTDLLEFDLSHDTQTDLEERSSQWFTKDLSVPVLPNGQLPHALVADGMWDELIANEATLKIDNMVEVSPLETQEVGITQGRYLVEYTITLKDSSTRTGSATFYMVFDRTQDAIWRISDVGEM